MLLRDQTRLVWQGPQRGPVSLSPDGDDLPVGAVHLGSADRQPGHERAVQLGKGRVERQVNIVWNHVIAGRSFDSIPSRPVGGQHVDGEAVMVSERGRLRVQRHRQPGCDMAPDDGLGAVVDDRARDATEVRERPPVAIPERR
jgi:hypothetical protein